MAKRYFLSPIIGTGTDADPIRPKVADYGVGWVGLIPSNPNGSAKFSWAFVIASATDFSALLADNALYALPDRLLNDGLTKQERSQISNKLNSMGVDASFMTAATTFLDVIRGVAKQLDVNFDETQFRIA